jgi:hypothetical protein
VEGQNNIVKQTLFFSEYLKLLTVEPGKPPAIGTYPDISGFILYKGIYLLLWQALLQGICTKIVLLTKRQGEGK